MEVIQSDITGKQIGKKESYKVDIYSRGSTTHLEFDSEFDYVKDLIANAIKNGQKWYKIQKDQNTGKWKREEIPNVGPN